MRFLTGIRLKVEGVTMQNGEVRDPIMVVVLSIVTCGIYALIMIMKWSEEYNAALGEERFNPTMELVLTLVTCGLWGIWFFWRATEATVEIQQRWGVEPKFDQIIMFVLYFVFYPAVLWMIQESLNNAWEQGTPGGGQAAV